MKRAASKKRPLRIGLDFDGVIADYLLLKSLVAKKILGKSIRPEMMESRFIDNTHPLTKAEYSAVQQEALFGSHADLLKPLANAIEGLNTLLENGHQLEIITSRTDAGLESARTWLKTFGITLPMTGVGYGNSKRPYVKNLDIYIDDDPDVLKKIGDVPTELFLFSSKGGSSKKIKSITSWQELLTLIS